MALGETIRAVAREAAQLLPPGPAWRPEPGTVLARLLEGLGVPIAVLEERAKDLADEADPRTATETLEDWERSLGLPDECLPEPTTDAERRALVLARALGPGAGTPAYFVALAAAIGVPITIEEGRAQPARVGETRVGDRLVGEVEDLVWTVFAPPTPVVRARVGEARVGDRLATYGDRLLECVLERYVPAHTFLRITYVSDDLTLRIDTGDGGPLAVLVEGNALRVGTSPGFLAVPIDGTDLVVGGSGLRVPLTPG